ncbi:MAG: cation diffusion facilitator family transporter [Actinomycetota bacterium]
MWGVPKVSREGRLQVTLGLNLAIVALQVVLGLLARSLGLLADAGHNLSDVAAVGLSLIAVGLSRRLPTDKRSFGYHRSSILAAQANAAAIVAVTLIIGFEAVRRLLHPSPVRGDLVIIVAMTAFLANLAAALLLREKGHDLNMRSACLHMAGDALSSLGVAVAGVAIVVTGGFYWLDPAVSLGIGLLIGWQALRLLRSTTDVLLESTPRGMSLSDLANAMEAVPGVDGVHDLHVWSLSSNLHALSAHVVLGGRPSLEAAQAVGCKVKEAVAGSFDIGHATLELECDECDGCSMDDIKPAAVARPGHHHPH